MRAQICSDPSEWLTPKSFSLKKWTNPRQRKSRSVLRTWHPSPWPPGAMVISIQVNITDCRFSIMFPHTVSWSSNLHAKDQTSPFQWNSNGNFGVIQTVKDWRDATLLPPPLKTKTREVKASRPVSAHALQIQLSLVYNFKYFTGHTHYRHLWCLKRWLRPSLFWGKVRCHVTPRGSKSNNAMFWLCLQGALPLFTAA